MKTKSDKKIAKAQAAHLAANVTTREADAALNRVQLTRASFKKARRAYKQARKAAKRAAKRAKEALKELAALSKYLKPAKKIAVRPRAKRPVAKARRRVKKKPVRTMPSTKTAIRLPDVTNPATPQVA